MSSYPQNSGQLYQGRFFQGEKGAIFGAIFGPWPAQRLIIHFPAFAEEMNLSRAVVTGQAIALAQQGWTTLVLDYYGTGDSDGDIAEANAELWLSDCQAIISPLLENLQAPPVFWGLRFGALMAAAYVDRYEVPADSRLLLWRPVVDGRVLLNQFFRLKQMSAMMQGGEAAKTNWLKLVEEGGSTEVAGYLMTPELVNSIKPLKLIEMQGAHTVSTCWLEPGLEKITPVIQKHVDCWTDAPLQLEFCSAQTFWQSPDVYEAPDLIEQTTRAVSTVGEA